MRQALKYAVAVAPGLIWLSGWLAAYYRVGSELSALIWIALGLLAAVISGPVIVLAFMKLRRGSDTPWVVVSLLFSLPVFVLSLIGGAALVLRQ